MTITEKIKWIVLPSLLVIGIGILEIKYPHAMDGFDDGYTGRGVAGLFMLLFELFIMFTWGTIGGAVTILLGVLAIAICFLPEGKRFEEQSPEISVVENDQSSSTTSLSSFAFRAGKTYVQRQLRNRITQR